MVSSFLMILFEVAIRPKLWCNELLVYFYLRWILVCMSALADDVNSPITLEGAVLCCAVLFSFLLRWIFIWLIGGFKSLFCSRMFPWICSLDSKANPWIYSLSLLPLLKLFKNRWSWALPIKFITVSKHKCINVKFLRNKALWPKFISYCNFMKKKFRMQGQASSSNIFTL